MLDRVICPACQKEGKKSTVTPGVCMKTAMYCPPFWDEDGKLHNHDCNTTTTQMRCSNGHHWEVKSKGSCWCGWPNKEYAGKEHSADDGHEENLLYEGDG